MSKEYSKEELENLVQGRIAQEKELLGPESKDNRKDSPAPLDFEFVNKCFLRNEVGGSELYSHIYHNKFACNDTSEHWMAFVGPHWEVDKMNRRALGATEVVVQAYLDFLLAPVEEELAKYDMNDKDERAAAKPIIVKKKVIQARIDRIFSKAGRTALLDCAATNLTPLFLSPDQLDQNQLLLPCANGVYDLENDEFRDGHPEDYLTSCSPYNFEGLDAKADKFAQYLFNSTGANQEDYDCLRRHIGYAITGLRKERMFMVLHGPHGQNGKGTLLNILNKILGSMAGSLQTEMLMQQRGGAKVGGPTPEILDLKGKHVVFASETEKNQKFANGLVKKWSGGDEMSGRGMNENFITRFDPTHTLIMICNNLPTAPADAFALPFIRKVTVCAAPQTTKTTFGHVACAWLSEFNPGNFLHVYPDEKTGVEILDERITKLFSDSPKLKKHLTGRKDDIAKHKLRLRGSVHRIAWAGSLQSLASRSVKYWVADEVDKYNERPSKKETTTLNQLKLRGRTYESSGKGMVLSSPSTETGFVWVELTKETQAVFVYWSKCPYCGIEQLMDFTKDTFYWPKGEDGHSLDRMEIEAKKIARYICQVPGCQKMWDDDARNTAQRINMKRGWHLRTDDGSKGEEMFAYLRRERPIYIGFIVPSWISYFVSLSSVASAYLKCKDKNLSPEEQFAAYQNFQNAHRSLPWKIELQAQPVNKILEFCDDRPEGILPGAEVVASLIGMVDTQDNGEFYFSIFAFGWGFQNDQWLVLRKHIHSFEEIVEYMWNSEYFDADGQRYVVEHVGIDMLGHRTKEVLEFCVQYEGLITPCFGSARAMTQPYAFSQREYMPGSDQPIPGGGLRAIRMNSKYYKDSIAIKLSQNPDSPGSIRLYNKEQVGEDYCKQLIAEARDENGKWVLIGSRANHYGDNLYGANCIADYLGVKHRIKPENNVEDIELVGVQEAVVDL